MEFPCAGLRQNSLKRYLEEIRNRALVPIIAHPERYRYLQKEPELAQVLFQEGALFQVNADSLCRGSGRAQFKLAKEMVNRGLVSFLATDAHGLDFRPNDLLEQLLCLSKKVRTDEIGAMLNENPELVLQNREITGVAWPGTEARPIKQGCQ